MITPRDLLLIDIDFSYQNFMEYIYDFYMKHVSLILEKFNLKAESVVVKKSTNGNTHIMIKLDKEIDYETMLHVLLALGCDLGLVSVSLMRLKNFGDPLVKQFSRKLRVRDK
ncbi:MAG: hypothetical protein C0179_00695 [Fervidicoccus sp.]|nr:MAG: hypothetical protein C0179_00695 [Fervidicoccus sp.]